MCRMCQCVSEKVSLLRPLLGNTLGWLEVDLGFERPYSVPHLLYHHAIEQSMAWVLHHHLLHTNGSFILEQLSIHHHYLDLGGH